MKKTGNLKIEDESQEKIDQGVSEVWNSNFSSVRRTDYLTLE